MYTTVDVIFFVITWVLVSSTVELIALALCLPRIKRMVSAWKLEGRKEAFEEIAALADSQADGYLKSAPREEFHRWLLEASALSSFASLVRSKR